MASSKLSWLATLCGALAVCSALCTISLQGSRLPRECGGSLRPLPLPRLLPSSSPPPPAAPAAPRSCGERGSPCQLPASLPLLLASESLPLPLVSSSSASDPDAGGSLLRWRRTCRRPLLLYALPALPDPEEACLLWLLLLRRSTTLVAGGSAAGAASSPPLQLSSTVLLPPSCTVLLLAAVALLRLRSPVVNRADT
jgi:hypothetical protein